MKRTRSVLALGVVAATAVTATFVVSKLPTKARSRPSTDFESAVTSDKVTILDAYVRKHEATKDPTVQDKVTFARMKTAFKLAGQGDYKTAELKFREAAKAHKGSKATSSDFGSRTDQAQYQAIVCVLAEGKRDEAIKQFRAFMKERQLSPLVFACHKRLGRLGVVTPADDEALTMAAARQEAHIKLETSMCGPKIIEHILPLMHRPAKEYHELAKLCGTTDNGTTIDGMRKGLKAAGLESDGLKVNRDDFRKLRTPFIMLAADHFLAVTSRGINHATVYDTLREGEHTFDISKLDNQFLANVIAFSLPVSFTMP